MPTNRPFFANFFSAFRARSSPTFQAKSTSGVASSSITASAHVINTANSATTSTARNITTKAGQDAVTQSAQSTTVSSTTRPTTSSPLPFSGTTSSHRYAPPLSRSPGTTTPTGTSYTNPSLSMSPAGASTPITRGRQRRGSDSSNSSGGFMDALGPDKWYIGGRTATGDESFYKLALVTGGNGRRTYTHGGAEE